MRIKSGILALTTVLVAGACDRAPEGPPPDRLDLSWMDTANFAPSVASPLEAGLVTEGPEDVALAEPKAAARKNQTTTTAARRSSNTGTRASAPAPARTRTETVRHTARDAAIGAAGGAVIGAVAGGRRHRVKGAIIGGAAGAVLGGVIGHTIDKEERVVRY